MAETATLLPNERIRVLARMSEEAYNFHRTEAPTLPGWFKLEKSRLATIFYHPAEPKQVVVAYKGSSKPEDRSTDFNIFHGREFRATHTSNIEMLDPMFKAGERLFIQTMQSFPDANVSITGHSLGGSIAELLAVKYNQHSVETDVFNPGMGQNKSYKYLKSSMSPQHEPGHLRRHLVRNDPASLVSGNGLGRTLFYSPMKGYDEHDIRQFSLRPSSLDTT